MVNVAATTTFKRIIYTYRNERAWPPAGADDFLTLLLAPSGRFFYVRGLQRWKACGWRLAGRGCRGEPAAEPPARARALPAAAAESCRRKAREPPFKWPPTPAEPPWSRPKQPSAPPPLRQHAAAEPHALRASALTRRRRSAPHHSKLPYPLQALDEPRRSPDIDNGNQVVTIVKNEAGFIVVTKKMRNFASVRG